MDRIEMLKRYIDEDPEDSFSRYALSLEYIRLNNFPEAKRILSELMFKDPDYLASYYQMGKLNESTGSIDEAAYVYQKGMVLARLQKNQHTFNELEGALKQLQGDVDEEE